MKKYLVHWKGLDHEYSEIIKSDELLKTAPDLVAEFERRQSTMMAERVVELR